MGTAEPEGALEEDCGTVGLVSVGQLRGCAHAILLYSIRYNIKLTSFNKTKCKERKKKSEREKDGM